VNRIAVLMLAASIGLAVVRDVAAQGKPLAVKPEAVAFDSGRDPAPIIAAVDREWRRILDAAGVPASPDADDAEFLRRACLDITGRIPSYERTVAFLASENPAKRYQAIDDLLASREFGQHFGRRWKLLIQPRDTSTTKQSADRFTPWLADQFNANRPWTEIATELLTTEAAMSREPQATFFQANSEESSPKPSLLAAATGRLFLGVQVACAECHNHPFAEWTQDDFWSLAAFFTRVRKRTKGDYTLTEDPPESSGNTATVATHASIKIPDGAGKSAGREVAARFLDGSEPAIADAGPLRPALAAWITSHDNPYFARATVNRLWAHFLGRGIVHPVDDFRAENPPSHPELLALLAREFAESGHDVKHLVRCICNSQAYQRTSRPLAANEADATRFSHAAVKVMTPDVLYDSLVVVLSARPTGESSPPAGKKLAVKLWPFLFESRDAFVRFFARAPDVDRGDQFGYGVPQLLRIMNSPEFSTGAPFIGRLVAAGTEPTMMIERLYLVALSRRPTADELQRMLDLVGERTSSEQAYADVLWVLLNTSEFVLNR